MGLSELKLEYMKAHRNACGERMTEAQEQQLERRLTGYLDLSLPKFIVVARYFRRYLSCVCTSGRFFISSNKASMMSETSRASSSRSAIGALPKSIAP